MLQRQLPALVLPVSGGQNPFGLDSHQKVKETHVSANHVTTSNCWLRDFLISILQKQTIYKF